MLIIYSTPTKRDTPLKRCAQRILQSRHIKTTASYLLAGIHWFSFDFIIVKIERMPVFTPVSGLVGGSLLGNVIFVLIKSRNQCFEINHCNSINRPHLFFCPLFAIRFAKQPSFAILPLLRPFQAWPLLFCSLSTAISLDSLVSLILYLRLLNKFSPPRVSNGRSFSFLLFSLHPISSINSHQKVWRGVRQLKAILYQPSVTCYRGFYVVLELQ